MSIARTLGRVALERLGLLEKYRFYRAERLYRGRYRRFKRAYGRVLRRPPGAPAPTKTALLTSVHFPEVELEFAVVKALEAAGYRVVVLLNREKWLHDRYYALADLHDVHMWSEFTPELDLAAARQIVQAHGSIADLLKFEHDGIRVGRFAITTAMRVGRQGALDLESPQDRELLARWIARGIAATSAAHEILERFQPDLAVFIDKGYSPKGELFDLCLDRGVDCVSWDLAHKSSTLMFKRFNFQNRDTNNNTISEDTWRLFREMEFGDRQRDLLWQELHRCYESGDWYSVVGTQFNRRLMSVDELRSKLGLDPAKRTAVIFSHVSWDASFFWGESLFEDYEKWLVETVRVACANDNLNWVVKIHPAHVGSAVRESYHGEPAEAVALRKQIGELPPHVRLMPADTEASTFSVFEMTDYCVTVRGTCGMEASSLGIPVITAGTGRYDRRGFTYDSDTREEYLRRIANLHEIPPRLTPEQRDLAMRFSYGFFLMRPLPLESVTLTYDKQHDKRRSEGRIHVRRPEDWTAARDVRMLADWFSDRSREDFLLPLDHPSLAPPAVSGERKPEEDAE